MALETPERLEKMTNFEQVYQQLFDEYYRPLCYFAFKSLKDLDLAEEMVQEVFYKLWKGRQKINIEHSASGYLYRAVYNECMNWHKHQQVVHKYEHEQASNIDVAAHDYAALELQERITDLIDEMPEKRREIFLKSRFEGKKYKEIAQELGISIKTVENQMGKALAFFRNALSDYFIIVLCAGLCFLSWFK